MKSRRSRSAIPLRAPLLLAVSIVTIALGCGLQAQGLPGNTGGGPAKTCSSPQQCDDGNACTADGCTSDGLCTNDIVADGPAPDGSQVVGDCKTIHCSAGQASVQNDDTDFPSAQAACHVSACSAGVVKQSLLDDGTQCSDPMGRAGLCAQGDCLVKCSAAMPCPDPGPCAAVSCQAGVCVLAPLPDGTPTPGVTQKVGDCHVRICESGKDLDNVDDSDVPVTASDCDTEVCTAGVPTNPAKPAENPCSTAPVGAGVCDAGGLCVECNATSQCSTAMDTECQHVTCDANHACSMVFTPANTPLLAGQVKGDCKQLQCDGVGHAVGAVDTNDKPDDGNECTIESCSVAGMPSSTPAPAMTACGAMNGKCNATGQCMCGGNGDCKLPNKCVGGFCGCTPLTCSGQGKTCGTVSDGCFNPTLICDDQVQNGTETDVDCGGTAAGCATRCAQGKKCVANGDCASGFCADGVCCNTACAATCQACSAAKKGLGVDGLCGAIVQGKDPDSECAPEATSTCGRTGACNGSGACETYAPGTVCVAQSCTNGTVTNAKTCNGSMMCAAGGTKSCGGFACNGTDCYTTCSDSTQCAAGHGCIAGACITLKPNGMACTVAGECTTGNCADGVCCDHPCSGTCEACTAAKKGSGGDGTCGDIPAGLDPDDECGLFTCAGGGKCVIDCNKNNALCNAGYYCNSSGTCAPKIAAGDPCSAMGACLSGHCADGVCCDTKCDAACQACTAALKGGGTDGTCGNLPVGTGCGGSHHCDAMGGCH
jgi:hypothetical protein